MRTAGRRHQTAANISASSLGSQPMATPWAQMQAARTPSMSPRLQQQQPGASPPSLVHSQSLPLRGAPGSMPASSQVGPNRQQMLNSRPSSIGSIPGRGQVPSQGSASQIPPGANAAPSSPAKARSVSPPTPEAQTPSPMRMSQPLSPAGSVSSVAGQGQRRDSGSVAASASPVLLMQRRDSGLIARQAPLYDAGYPVDSAAGSMQSLPEGLSLQSVSSSAQQLYRPPSQLTGTPSGLLRPREELPRFGGGEEFVDLQDLLRRNPPPLAGSIEGIIAAFTSSMKQVRTKTVRTESSGSGFIRETWASNVSHAAIGTSSDVASPESGKSQDPLGDSISALSGLCGGSMAGSARFPQQTPAATPRVASTPSLKAAAMAVLSHHGSSGTFPKSASLSRSATLSKSGQLSEAGRRQRDESERLSRQQTPRDSPRLNSSTASASSAQMSPWHQYSNVAKRQQPQARSQSSKLIDSHPLIAGGSYSSKRKAPNKSRSLPSSGRDSGSLRTSDRDGSNASPLRAPLRVSEIQAAVDAAAESPRFVAPALDSPPTPQEPLALPGSPLRPRGGKSEDSTPSPSGCHLSNGCNGESLTDAAPVARGSLRDLGIEEDAFE